MANMIRNDTNIKGILTPLNREVKLSQYADDTVLTLKDYNSFVECRKHIEIFCKASGMKLNKSKTEGMWLGKFYNDTRLRQLHFDNHNSIKWIPPDQVIRSLGTMLTIEGDHTNFWNNKLKVIHNRLNNWRRLYPSRLGKKCC